MCARRCTSSSSTSWARCSPTSACRRRELRRQVDEQLLRALSQERFALTVAERQVLVQSVTDDVLGYGPIDRFLRDDAITEVMVNGPDLVYVERSGKLEQTDVEFVDETTSGGSSTRS